MKKKGKKSPLARKDSAPEEAMEVCLSMKLKLQFCLFVTEMMIRVDGNDVYDDDDDRVLDRPGLQNRGP